jgi:transcriptional regulator with XRE-family HTH domain
MQSHSKLAFGPRLRAERERRGITLDALAASTKINRALLADLERNDVSRWPAGIYRRAFVREYAKAVGLPANIIVEEFSELFPDSQTKNSRQPDHHDSVDGAKTLELRLALADVPRPAPQVMYSRLVAAARALGLVLATGYVVSLVTGVAYWTASGVVALIWYPAAAVVYGDGPFRRMLSVRRFRRWPALPTTAVPSVAPHITSTRAAVAREVDLTGESLRVDSEIHGLSVDSPAIH